MAGTSRKDRRTLKQLDEIVKATANEKIKINYDRISSILRACEIIFRDKGFISLLLSEGVSSSPRPLLAYPPSVDPLGNGQVASGTAQGDPALSFAVAWIYFSKLTANAVIATQLERDWPGFVLELRSTFESISSDGSFFK